MPNGEPTGFLVDHQIGGAHEQPAKDGKIVVVLELEGVDDDVASRCVRLDCAVGRDVCIGDDWLGVGNLHRDAVLKLDR